VTLAEAHGHETRNGPADAAPEHRGSARDAEITRAKGRVFDLHEGARRRISISRVIVPLEAVRILTARIDVAAEDVRQLAPEALIRVAHVVAGVVRAEVMRVSRAAKALEAIVECIGNHDVVDARPLADASHGQPVDLVARADLDPGKFDTS